MHTHEKSTILGAQLLFFFSPTALHAMISGHLANEPAGSLSHLPLSSSSPFLCRSMHSMHRRNSCPIQFEATVKSSVSSSQADRQWWFMSARDTATSHFRRSTAEPRFTRFPPPGTCVWQIETWQTGSTLLPAIPILYWLPWKFHFSFLFFFLDTHICKYLDMNIHEEQSETATTLLFLFRFNKRDR